MRKELRQGGLGDRGQAVHRWRRRNVTGPWGSSLSEGISRCHGPRLKRDGREDSMAIELENREKKAEKRLFQLKESGMKAGETPYVNLMSDETRLPRVFRLSPDRRGSGRRAKRETSTKRKSLMGGKLGSKTFFRADLGFQICDGIREKRRKGRVWSQSGSIKREKIGVKGKGSFFPFWSNTTRGGQVSDASRRKMGNDGESNG